LTRGAHGAGIGRRSAERAAAAPLWDLSGWRYLMLGGYHGFPARLGGAKPVAKIYHEALRSALPSALQSAPGSLLDCETLATARLLTVPWKAQQRYEANLHPDTAYSLL